MGTFIGYFLLDKIILVIINIEIQQKQSSSNSFRSSDLGVMGPARYHCAMLLPDSQYGIADHTLCFVLQYGSGVNGLIRNWFFLILFSTITRTMLILLI